MKLLLDQGLPRSAASILRTADIDAIHTGEIGYATAEDSEIIDYAIEHERVIVTLDADFHRILALSGLSLPSVIRIRLQGLRGEATAKLIQRIIADWQAELEQGVMLAVESERVRFRYLPIIRDRDDDEN